MGRDCCASVVLVRDGCEVASWPLGGTQCPDLAAVDELARLHLAARRGGYAVVLRDVCRELTELLDLVGLGVLASDADA